MGLADDKYTGYNWINLVSGEISTLVNVYKDTDHMLLII